MKGNKVLLAGILSAMLITAIVIFSVAKNALANIPAPDSIIHGTVMLDGEFLTAESQAIVSLKLDQNDEPIASYTLGSNPAAEDFYVLRVPIYARAEGAPEIPEPGDAALIYINGILADMVTIGAMGSIQVINLSIRPGDGDTDGDGLSNALEQTLGTDSNNSDTDGDGISDGDEVTLYLINPLRADTDEDGLPDGWEMSYNLNPSLNDALADADDDGFTNLEEYQTNLNPLDAESKPLRIFYLNNQEISELDAGLHIIYLQLASPTLHYTSFDLLKHFAVHGDIISIHCDHSLAPDIFSKSTASYWFFGQPSGVDFVIVSDRIYRVDKETNY